MKGIIIFSVALLATHALAESECEKQKKKEAFNTSPLKLDVKCLPNGDYAPLQCFPGSKMCYCASPDGNQITQPSKNRKFCACELKKNEVTKKLNVNGRPIDPPNGTWVPNCQRDGLYYSKQCESGTNVCWCIDQDGKQISKERKANITCT